MSYELTLLSPAGSKPYVYKCYPSKNGGDEIINAEEIIETMRLVCDDLPELRSALDDDLTKASHRQSLSSLKHVTNLFNKELTKYQSQTETTKDKVGSQASRPLLRHILQQAYNQSVTSPEKLNQYTPFTAEVYGETSFDVICQAIDHANITENDTFIDLGSGVGQVVLQIAALTPCKFSCGIELGEWPNRYAEVLDVQFRSLMKWWGKKHGEFKLFKGDFLDLVHSERLKQATVIFVNNYAFDPKLDLELKARFTEATEGTRIISSKAFCPVNFRITNRNLSDIGCFMNVFELPRGPVSWTSNPLSYYLHVIDRTKLFKYFEGQKSKEKTKVRSKKENHIPNKSKQVDENANLNDANLNATVITERKMKDSLDAFLEQHKSDCMAQIAKFGDAAFRESVEIAIRVQEEIHRELEEEVRLLEQQIDLLERENASTQQKANAFDALKARDVREFQFESSKSSGRKRTLSDRECQQNEESSPSHRFKEFLATVLGNSTHENSGTPRRTTAKEHFGVRLPAEMKNKLKLSRHLKLEQLDPRQLQRIGRWTKFVLVQLSGRAKRKIQR